MNTFTLAQPVGYEQAGQQVVTGVTPSAGANFSLTVDGRYWLRLVAASFTFTASAAAANRVVALEVQDGDSNTIEAAVVGAAITANQAIKVRASIPPSTTVVVATTAAFMWVPRMFIPGGYKVAITVAAIDASDAITAIKLVFDRFATGSDMVPQAVAGL